MGTKRRKGKNFLESDLKIPKAKVDDIVIERAHHNGKNAGRRPICALFLKWKDRQFVFNAAKENLSGDSNYNVKQDFSDSTRDARRKLAPYYEKAIKEKRRVKVVMDKIIVDGLTYKCNYKMNDLQHINSK